LGYLYYYGQSLWVNVFAHFLNNTIVVILYFLAARGVVDVDMAESMDFPFVVVLVTAIVCMVLFWLFFVADEKKIKKK
jgi:membrane protease YdiL (CAAX protease family)